MSHLVELLIRATILGCFGLIAWWLARNRSAESRVTILRAILAGLAILPALWALGPRWSFDMPGMAKPAPVVVDMSPDFIANATLTTESAPGPTPVDLLPYVYFGLATLLIVPALIGRHMIERVWQRGVSLTWTAEDELCEALDSVGVKQPVEARMGALASPMVFGVWRRRLLVPLGFDEWPEEHRRLALLHEAAHLRRFDCAWQHLAHGVRAVYWCHPLVWFLSGALKDETELAADERAIRSGAEAADYASALVAIARILQEPGRLVRSQGVTFMNHRQLDRRVRSVLHGRRRGFTIPGALALAAMVISGTTIAASAAPEAPRAEILFAEQKTPVLAPGGPTSTPVIISQPLVVAQQVRKDKKGKKSKKVTAQTVIISRPVKVKQGNRGKNSDPILAPAASPRSVSLPQGSPLAPRAAAAAAQPAPNIATPLPRANPAMAPRAANDPIARPAVAPKASGDPVAVPVPQGRKGGLTYRVSTPFEPATRVSSYSPLGGRALSTTYRVNTASTARTLFPPKVQAQGAPGVPILKDVPIVGQFFRATPAKTSVTSSGVTTTINSLGGTRSVKAGSMVFGQEKVAGAMDTFDTATVLQGRLDAKQSAEALARKAADYGKIKEYLEKVRKEHGDPAREEALLKVLAEQAKTDSAASLSYRTALDSWTTARAYSTTGTWATAPLRNRGKATTFNWSYPALSSGKTLELTFTNKKPVTITLIVNGKPQKVRVTPDSQGRVTVEVGHDGSVKVKSGGK